MYDKFRDALIGIAINLTNGTPTWKAVLIGCLSFSCSCACEIINI